MLPFLAEMRELVTAIRIQERVGGNSLGSGITPSSSFPHCLPVSELQRPEYEIWDVGQRPQGEQIATADGTAQPSSWSGQRRRETPFGSLSVPDRDS